MISIESRCKKKNPGKTFWKLRQSSAEIQNSCEVTTTWTDILYIVTETYNRYTHHTDTLESLPNTQLRTLCVMLANINMPAGMNADSSTITVQYVWQIMLKNMIWVVCTHIHTHTRQLSAAHWNPSVYVRYCMCVCFSPWHLHKESEHGCASQQILCTT